MNPGQKKMGPLRRRRLRELITSEFVGTGQEVSRAEVAKTCLALHLEQGGSQPGEEIGRLTGKALRDLRDEGRVRNPDKNVWIFDIDPARQIREAVPPSIEPVPAGPVEDQAPSTVDDLSRAPEFRAIGKGEEIVYAYYFPVYRERADWFHRPDWEIKVGMTNQKAQGRIKSQVQSPEGWETLLEIRCPNSRRVESSLHNALKERGHWIPPRSEGGTAEGSEWFRVSPEDLLAIAASVLDVLGIPLDPEAEDLVS